MRQVGVANQCADAQAAVGKPLNGVQADPVDVDQLRRPLDVELHKVEERGASSDKAHVLIGRGIHCLLRHRWRVYT